MKNKMSDVRDHLVSAMESLNDKDVDPAMIERAKAIADLAQVYTNSVKVEIDARRMAGVEALPEVLSHNPSRLVSGAA